MCKVIKVCMLCLFHMLFFAVAAKAQASGKRSLNTLLPESIKEQLKDRKPVTTPQAGVGRLPSKNRDFLNYQVPVDGKNMSKGNEAALSKAQKQKMLPSHSRNFLDPQLRRSRQ